MKKDVKTLRALVKNLVKESFYGKKKKINKNSVIRALVNMTHNYNKNNNTTNENALRTEKTLLLSMRWITLSFDKDS